MLEWIGDHQAWMGAMAVISLITFVGSLIAIPVLVARIPADYFLNRKPPPGSWRETHPVIRMTMLILKNALGVLFLAAGIAMLVLPGQGIITILIGITLMSFPGKRALELRLVSIPAVFRSINWIRSKTRQPALRLPAPR